jgi:hypothetical protein
MEGLEGVDTGLEASKPESVIRSRQYFLWHKEISDWDQGSIWVNQDPWFW